MSDTYYSILHRVKFSFLLILYIPAVVLSLLIYGFFWKYPIKLRTPENQALLISLMVNFIQLVLDVSFANQFYYFGYITTKTSNFCTFRAFTNFTLRMAGEYLMATISIQRHVLIFNRNLLHIRRLRLVLFSFPLLLCIAYPALFYFLVFILNSCDGTQWDFANNGCGFTACYLVYNTTLGLIDLSINNTFPIIVIGLANMTLLVRIVKQKYRNQRRSVWRKQRRLTINLLCISSLYIISWSPSLITTFIQILVYPSNPSKKQFNYFLDLTLLPCLLFLPWVFFRLLPELRQRIRQLSRILWINHTVAPF